MYSGSSLPLSLLSLPDDARLPQPPAPVQGVTPRAWKQMSVAQQSSLHSLGLTPRGWAQRMEAGAREMPWAELSEKQREAAIVLGWDETSWSLQWGNQPPPDPVQWVQPKPPPPPRVSALEAIRCNTDFKTLGVFSQPSYTTIGDPFRAASEAVERRKIMPQSGVVHDALMNRARGASFTMKSPRHGKLKDAYFGKTHGGHQHSDDPALQKRREVQQHASFICTDRAHGTYGMTVNQCKGTVRFDRSGMTVRAGVPEPPIFAPTNPAKSTRS